MSNETLRDLAAFSAKPTSECLPEAELVGLILLVHADQETHEPKFK